MFRVHSCNLDVERDDTLDFFSQRIARYANIRTTILLSAPIGSLSLL